jgi:predicted enzyme related to lactoylglutathione lyase
VRADSQITFLYVADLAAVGSFYRDVLGLEQVLDQGGCLIFRVAGDAYVGVCDRPHRAGVNGALVTYVTDDVDEWFERIVSSGASVEGPPASNPQYGIYHFYASDPAGNRFEVQRFDDPRWAAAPGRE